MSLNKQEGEIEMKREYKKPEISILAYMDEIMLTQNTKESVIISGGGFDPVEGPITEIDDEGGEPSGAKGSDSDVVFDDDDF